MPADNLSHEETDDPGYAAISIRLRSGAGTVSGSTLFAEEWPCQGPAYLRAVRQEAIKVPADDPAANAGLAGVASGLALRSTNAPGLVVPLKGKGHTFTVYFQHWFHLAFFSVRQSIPSRCDNRLLLLFCQLMHGPFCQATENAATVQALIDNLVERGLDPTVPRGLVPQSVGVAASTARNSSISASWCGLRTRDWQKTKGGFVERSYALYVTRILCQVSKISVRLNRRRTIRDFACSALLRNKSL